MKGFSLPLVLLLGVAGCSLMPTDKPLISGKSLLLTSETSISYADLAAGLVIAGVIHLVYDPLAPNWSIQETRLNEESFAYALTMKRYHTGGAGEAMQVLRRRAEAVQRVGGFAGYQILEYSEGIESKTLGAQRVAMAKVRMLGPTPGKGLAG